MCQNYVSSMSEYVKILGSLWQPCKGIPGVYKVDVIKLRDEKKNYDIQVI